MTKQEFVTRRANRFYIERGPAALVRPATQEELIHVLSDMQRSRHVNSNIVAYEIKEREIGPSDRYPMTYVELVHLNTTRLGLKLIDFARSVGVERIYSVEEKQRAAMPASRPSIGEPVTVVVLDSRDEYTRHHPEYEPAVYVFAGHLDPLVAQARVIAKINDETNESWEAVANVESGPSADDVPPTMDHPTLHEWYHVYVSRQETIRP